MASRGRRSARQQHQRLKIPGFYTVGMRLTQEEQRGIAEAARLVLPAGSRVVLFGSRTDDARRGGDVDLLVETTFALAADESVRLCRRLTARLYRCLGERRIDMLMSVHGAADERDVVRAARQNGIELART
jgi:uncharacterized protein